MSGLLAMLANTGGDIVIRSSCIKATVKPGQNINLSVSYGRKTVTQTGTVKSVTRDWMRSEFAPNETWYNDRYCIEIPGCPICLNCYAEEFGFQPEAIIYRRQRRANPDLDKWVRDIGVYPDAQTHVVNPPSQDTFYRRYLEAVEASKKPDASIEVLDQARLALAARVGLLVGKQRKHFHLERKLEIERLQEEYRMAVNRLIALGWK